jgi:hypothetical protein
MSKTLGQKRVKAEFNPTKDGHVDVIKNKCSELIDILEEMRAYPQTGTGEKQRLISLAQTEIECAAMWAVKANFTD